MDTREPVEWPYLAQHITTPRRSWMDAGKVRQHAPPTDDDMTPNVEAVDAAHLHYVGVYLESHKPRRYYYKLALDTGREIIGYGFMSPAKAARAYDECVRAFELELPMNFGSEGEGVA